VPLIILAACTMLLGFIGAPSWPWFQDFLEDKYAVLNLSALRGNGILPVMLSSSTLVFIGLALGWTLYGRKITHAEQPDALQQIQPHTFSLLHHAFYIDRLYAHTIVRLNTLLSHVADKLDRWFFNAIVQAISYLVLGLAYTDNFVDTRFVNAGFDAGCTTVSRSAKLLAFLQRGRIQSYLRYVGLAFFLAVALLLWRAKA